MTIDEAIDKIGDTHILKAGRLVIRKIKEAYLMNKRNGCENVRLTERNAPYCAIPHKPCEERSTHIVYIEGNNPKKEKTKVYVCMKF